MTAVPLLDEAVPEAARIVRYAIDCDWRQIVGNFSAVFV